MQNYTDLNVWQKSMDLVEEVYTLVKRLPKEEMYALSSQLRRAAVSIPSNIAEGNGRSSKKEYLRFLLISRGSTFEVETQLLICVKVEYLVEEEIERAMTLCSEVKKMLNGLIRNLSAPIENTKEK